MKTPQLAVERLRMDLTLSQIEHELAKRGAIVDRVTVRRIGLGLSDPAWSTGQALIDLCQEIAKKPKVRK